LKLSKRLKQLEKMVGSDYDHIWDCCCDHGFLGMHLLSEQRADTIHFVDIVPSLITKIKQTLERYDSIHSSSWETHCIDVSALPLDKYQGKQLIIIAGVGGDLMSRMVDAIRQRHQHLDLDFLLCPVHRQYALRNKLINFRFSLKDEVLIEDKNRFYEILLVSSVSDSKHVINPIGNKIWCSTNAEQYTIANKHLENILNYYRRNQQGDNTVKVDHIIDAYSAVKLAK